MMQLSLFADLPLLHRPVNIKARRAIWRHTCLDCGVDTSGRGIAEYYMVANEVWLVANPADAGMLCIGCIEKRLGRKLKSDDFLACPLNDHPTRFRKSKRLRDRLGAGCADAGPSINCTRHDLR
jgi:hypothetical protein